MKILFIAPRYSGGIGGHAARVAEKLEEYGFEIKLMHTSHIPIKKLKNPSFVAFSSLKAIISKEKYDVVHAFNVPSAFAMRYTKSKKKVLTIHGIHSEQVDALHSKTISTAAKITETKVLDWADKLTTDSKIVKKTYKDKLNVNFEFFYAPLDIKKFEEVKNRERKEKQIIFIGRDSYEKGIDILKEVEPKINAKVVYCTNTKWNDAMEELQASSLLVVPSRMESIPQVIKEAFYLKIPVIATNVGGIPELITNNETGILIPPNDPKALENSINTLLQDNKIVKKISEKGYEFVINNLTWEILLPKYVKFYEDLVNS